MWRISPGVVPTGAVTSWNQNQHVDRDMVSLLCVQVNVSGDKFSVSGCVFVWFSSRTTISLICQPHLLRVNIFPNSCMEQESITLLYERVVCVSIVVLPGILSTIDSGAILEFDFLVTSIQVKECISRARAKVWSDIICPSISHVLRSLE